jgi:circadian clock protein KaiC
LRTTTGVEGIDTLIEGGIPRGSATLVSGEAGTGKSVLCIQFILAGIREGESGVFATADHPGRVIEAASSLGWDLRGAVDDGYARVVRIERNPAPVAEAAPPTDEAQPADEDQPADAGEAAEAPQAPSAPAKPSTPTEAAEAAAATIAAAVAEIGAERVAIDPPMLAGSPDADSASEYIAALLRATLRDTHCTTLFSGLRVRGAPGLTRLGIEEQIADGIIDLRVEEEAGRRHRVLAVREMHGTRTNLDDHLFAILAGRGIVVGEA